MGVSASLVKELREKTGVGMLDCKKALEESEGDIQQALKLLREQGAAMAKEKQGRSTEEGRIGSYIHTDGKIGVLVEVNCETDFAAKNDEFKSLVKDISMQIAASQPEYVEREDVDKETVEEEKSILRNQAQQEDKPEHIIEKIVEGRLDKFYSDVCLYEQPFIKDTDKTVEEYINSKISVIGENIKVKRFVRYSLGEDDEDQ